jgi:hypothetical protein
MSNDAAMLSDDDKPLIPRSDFIGHDSHAPINGNGHVNGARDQDALMSEDEDDEMPLVRTVSLIRVTH